MKIERFVLGGFVAVVFFLMGMLLLGDNILQSQYTAGTVPTFNNATNYYDTTQATLQSNMEEETMTSDKASQSSVDLSDEDRFWVYQSKSLKAVYTTSLNPSEGKGALSELASYLKVNSMIVASLITFLMVSFSFAIAAWWKNRRP